MSQPSAGERVELARAVALAAAAPRPASPNPTVGCRVVGDGRVHGAGVSAPVGGPHAEVVALTAAGRRADGATLVVTLEPCAHHGRTPPCVDAVVRSGVRRVVVGRRDPDPIAAGGAARLVEAGLEVAGPLADGDVLAAAIDAELAGFRRATLVDRPHVTLKLAQQVDGGLVAPPGERWISGAAARRTVHRDRARVDAVLVGVGTVLEDDPVLDVRSFGPVTQPRPVVLDRDARTPPTARVVRPGTLVLVGAGDDPGVTARVDALASSGAVVRRVAPGPDGLDLDAALATLVAEGVTSVLAEPGPTLARTLLAGGCVDRIVLHVAPGGGAPRAAVPIAGWRAVRRGGAGADRIVELVRWPEHASVAAPAGRAA